MSYTGHETVNPLYPVSYNLHVGGVYPGDSSCMLALNFEWTVL
jgi:hypothetical protein